MALGEYRKCDTCKEWGWSLSHKCPPEWRVWIHEHHEIGDPNDCLRARGTYAEDAAQTAVNEWDEEYSLADGSSVTVCAEPVDGGEREWFEITDESVVEYHARECDPPDGFGEPREVLPLEAPVETPPTTTETGSGWPRPGRFTHDEALGPDCFGGTDDPGSD